LHARLKLIGSIQLPPIGKELCPALGHPGLGIALNQHFFELQKFLALLLVNFARRKAQGTFLIFDLVTFGQQGRHPTLMKVLTQTQEARGLLAQDELPALQESLR
jgi:hypothetical protein